MDLEVSYLRALIHECQNPVDVLRGANLPGCDESQEHARNSLLRHFDRISSYNATDHGRELTALKLLGVDSTGFDEVSVVLPRQR